MKRKPYPWYKSKTMWFSFIITIFGVLNDNMSYFQDLIDPKWYGSIMIAIGIIIALLRMNTTCSIEDK